MTVETGFFIRLVIHRGWGGGGRSRPDPPSPGAFKISLARKHLPPSPLNRLLNPSESRKVSGVKEKGGGVTLDLTIRFTFFHLGSI